MLIFSARSKPFQLKVRSNSDQMMNALNSQQGNSSFYQLINLIIKLFNNLISGFSLRYTQLPCVI